MVLDKYLGLSSKINNETSQYFNPLIRTYTKKVEELVNGNPQTKGTKLSTKKPFSFLSIVIILGVIGKISYAQPQADKQFNTEVFYSAEFDGAEEEKSMDHTIGFSLTYSLNPNWSIFSEIGISQQTIGNKFFKENTNNNYHRLSDLSLGLAFSTSVSHDFFKKLSSVFILTLPTSEQSQFENKLFAVHTTGGFTTPFWNNFSLSNKLSVSYVQNQNLFSTDNHLNKDFMVSNKLSLSLNYFRFIKITAGARLDTLRSLDNSWEPNFGNFISASGKVASLGIALSLRNNSFSDDRHFNFFFYNKYEKLYSLDVSYVF